MRQSLGSEDEKKSTDGSGGDNFRQMLREGRSFSGKERNCVFLNTASADSAEGQFATISAVSGADFPEDGRAVVQVDWDHDGDLDLWFSNRNEPRLRFLRNDIETQNQFVQFKLVGNGAGTNRNAVGARIRLFTTPEGETGEPKQQLRELRAGDGFISQGTLTVHFGFEQGAKIERVEVRWPDANSTVENFEDITANGRFVLVQGAGQAKRLDNEVASILEPSVLSPPAQSEKQRIPLLSRFSAPPLTYKALDGKVKTVPADKDQVTLLNLWSTTCAPCMKELKEFSERYSELQGHGIRVVALCIDELEGGLFDPESGDPIELTQAAVERLKMPFSTGMATPELVSQLQRLHNSMIESVRPVPLPTSFLIDRDGRLDVIYKGTVTLDELISDAVALPDQSLAARFVRSALLPGQLLKDPSAMEIIENASAQAHIKLARDLASENRIDEAVAEYEQGLRVLEDSAFMQNDLATLLTYQGKFQKAIALFRSALKLEPENSDYRINLAQALVSANQLGDAEKELKRVIRESPKNGNAHFYLGVIQGRQNQPELARISFETAIRNDPTNARAHFSLGSQHLQNRRYRLARESFENALEIEPQEVIVLTNLAKSLLRLDLPDLAERRVRQAIEIQPTFADAYYQLGTIQMYRGEEQAARVTFGEALRIQPGHPATVRAMRELQ